jgi:hypothetical protein
MNWKTFSLKLVLLIAAIVGTVGRFVRPFVWLVVCITAVGIHHTWFDIGTRGTLMAFADGAVLCLLSVAMHWLHSIIMRPNDSRDMRNS